LGSRFRGSSRSAVVLILAGSLVVSYLVSQQGVVLGRGIYRVGVSPDSPEIHDKRFSAMTLVPSKGYSMLNQKTIDLYLDGDKAALRNDARSLYAAGALKRYLERQELARIKDEYEIDRAFPLRVELNYIENVTMDQETSLRELLAPVTAKTPEPMEADSGALDESGARPTPRPRQSQQQETQRDSDSAVRQQIREMERGGRWPKIEMEFASDKEIIIPSLMTPPIPFAQVMIAFLYVLPVFFVSIFFTSSFMDEKTDGRIAVLMSAPVTPFEIIAGKMLPYATFSLASVMIITLLLKGNLLLAMAIFIPVLFFVFSIYLMVPLTYRTFRDTTFISMLAIVVITSYLVFPAMFSGVNDLCYISPLTLAVKMYRGEPFGPKEYLFSTVPMYLVFALSMYVGTRILNEEYLMRFRPLYRKVAEAIYLAIDRSHPNLSIMLLSLFLIPIVYMIQLVAVALSFNMPISYAVGGLLLATAMIEEMAKSVGIAVLLEKGVVSTPRHLLALSFLSAAGFLIGEKLLLYLSLTVVTESTLSAALFSYGMLLIPLTAHFAFTAIVCFTTRRSGVRYYPFAVFIGSTAHALYNLCVLGVIP